MPQASEIPCAVYTAGGIIVSLVVTYHDEAVKEIEALVDSEDECLQEAAAQILQLIDLVETSPLVRDRILAPYQTITVRKADGSFAQVDIKLIQELKDVANDQNHCTDAVRRIRDLINKPADEYRVFFAPRQSLKGPHRFQVLGVFHRDSAYTKSTIDELKRRYES